MTDPVEDMDMRWMRVAVMVFAAAVTHVGKGAAPTPGPPDAAPTRRFEILAARWVEHTDRVAFRSLLDAYLDHDSYRALAAMGVSIVPSIVERYPRDRSWAQGGTLRSGAEAMLHSGTCCVLIAPASSKTLFEWQWLEHELEGTMIGPAAKLLDRPASKADRLRASATAREVFAALGTGLLHIESGEVHWPLDDGNRLRMAPGASLDAPVRALVRDRSR